MTTRLEELRAELETIGLRVEALGWRLAAQARALDAARERLEREMGHRPTLPLLLRPPVKAERR